MQLKIAQDKGIEWNTIFWGYNLWIVNSLIIDLLNASYKLKVLWSDVSVKSE